MWTLQHWVREREVLSLETAIAMLTGAPGELFGIRDRGRITPEAYADLVLFDPDHIGIDDVRYVQDMPAGGTRLVAEPVGIVGERREQEDRRTGGRADRRASGHAAPRQLTAPAPVACGAYGGRLVRRSRELAETVVTARVPRADRGLRRRCGSRRWRGCPPNGERYDRLLRTSRSPHEVLFVTGHEQEIVSWLRTAPAVDYYARAVGVIGRRPPQQDWYSLGAPIDRRFISSNKFSAGAGPGSTARMR